MLTLESGSLCDVCAEEFGPRNLPHCIPCGHVLCLNCCNNILEKTTSRLPPACPFCREQFTRGTVRLIRIDFNSPSSGWSTPRRSPNSPRPPLIEDDFPNDLLLKASAPAFPEPGEARAREGRMLESKVARVASKKCSVEEVTALKQEVDRWLTEVTAADASSALYLSSLLLKAILANHEAFSEATKTTKHAEANLKFKMDGLELEKGRLEAELHKPIPVLTVLQKVQYNQKVQECQSLRTELSRFVSNPAVSTASSAASAHTGLSSPSRSSVSPPDSRVASPTTTSPSYIPNIISPLARLGLSRSASVAPTPPSRSASVAPTSPSRSASTVPPRISTPAVSSSAHRSATPSFRSSTPVSPSPVRKSRTMSMSQQRPPLPPSDQWPAALTAATPKPSAPTAAPRPHGPRVPTRV
ncbi:hypothetical protein F5148DRAFT_1008791 [Russula earlei]|uniref:Uncharacterized protein n=1 Tax=Russula earlei TaxID=71964 RepID=A0ACC0UK03_9AGAM|nr:hypothetical protein F5148DRAFT_1008791 [Russula earlei]